MTHEQMQGLYEFYLLGVLDEAEALQIREHLETDCQVCAEQIRGALPVTAALSGMAPSMQPSAGLRKRVLAAIQPERKTSAFNWLWPLAAACAALLVLSFWLASSVNRYKDQIRDLEAERTQLRAAVDILSKSETKAVQFGIAQNRPQGHVFVNRQRGLVFVGSDLPQLSQNRTFQLWLIPTKGAPESVGLFRPSVSGTSLNIRTTPIDTARYQAVAVSVEPNGGSPAPTTTPILIVPLG